MRLPASQCVHRPTRRRRRSGSLWGSSPGPPTVRSTPSQFRVGSGNAARPGGGRRAACGAGATRLRRTSVLSLVTASRSEEHTSELQSRGHLVCRLLLEKKNEEHATEI